MLFSPMHCYCLFNAFPYITTVLPVRTAFKLQTINCSLAQITFKLSFPSYSLSTI